MVFNTGAALLDAIVLAVVSKEREGTYGYKITQDVRRVIDISDSTLYPVLRRLQKDECLMVYDMEFAGRNRRYYKVTEKGTAQLRLYETEWKNYSSKISMLFEGEDRSMNRDEFMAQLARLLVEMPENERMEAIRYYNDYFDEAGEENESKVIQELGSPGRVAASIKANLQDGASTEHKEEHRTTDGYTDREHNSQETTQDSHSAGNASQEYTYGGSDRGEYTENGYRENWNTSSDWNDTQAANMAVQKQRNTGKWALLIVLLVFASPILLGVGGGILGGILGLLGGLFGILAACLAGGIGLVFGGAAILVKGIVNVVNIPAMGLTGMGGGLLAISLGLLLMVLFLWFCFQIIPRLFRTILNFASRILHKGKGGATE